MYPKFFTPNGDGTNDTWHIKYSDNEPQMKLIIYDRYGKMITSYNGLKVGWDGKYNGQLLPSDDYWFVVQRENGKEYKGHFALKR
jgi:gliding motility-associated-like protein